MPGGIGRVDRETALSCRGRDGNRVIPANATETAIFYRLSGGRVCYDSATERLYFVESTHFPVSRIIGLMFQGMGISPSVEQLYLDATGFFNGARRLSLNPEQARTILTALRVSGVEIIPLDRDPKTAGASG